MCFRWRRVSCVINSNVTLIVCAIRLGICIYSGFVGFDVGEAVKSVFVCCSQCPCAITVLVSGFIWLFFVPKLSPSLLHGSSGDILMCRNDL